MSFFPSSRLAGGKDSEEADVEVLVKDSNVPQILMGRPTARRHDTSRKGRSWLKTNPKARNRSSTPRKVVQSRYVAFVDRVEEDLDGDLEEASFNLSSSRSESSVLVTSPNVCLAHFGDDTSPVFSPSVRKPRRLPAMNSEIGAIKRQRACSGSPNSSSGPNHRSAFSRIEVQQKARLETAHFKTQLQHLENFQRSLCLQMLYLKDDVDALFQKVQTCSSEREPMRGECRRQSLDTTDMSLVSITSLSSSLIKSSPTSAQVADTRFDEKHRLIKDLIGRIPQERLRSKSSASYFPHRSRDFLVNSTEHKVHTNRCHGHQQQCRHKLTGVPGKGQDCRGKEFSTQLQIACLFTLVLAQIVIQFVYQSASIT
ncbi:uncharacterized protein LOC101862731 isoform X1 [Aplysia californica]|uniref:Uncharacterized protein LOC101862731 isoform X1 n=2 Tax=Aplysia californica TaxID=6500 RepID=A0ABM1VUC0_APLCA|nr:uncharacterized protein LOC101862731 isoform X1 [Aplysia californica]